MDEHERNSSRGGRRRTPATIEGTVENLNMHRSKDRRSRLVFDLLPADERLPTIAVSVRGDDARRFSSALENGSRVRGNS